MGGVPLVLDALNFIWMWKMTIKLGQLTRAKNNKKLDEKSD